MRILFNGTDSGIVDMDHPIGDRGNGAVMGMINTVLPFFRLAFCKSFNTCLPVSKSSAPVGSSHNSTGFWLTPERSIPAAAPTRAAKLFLRLSNPTCAKTSSYRVPGETLPLQCFRCQVRHQIIKLEDEPDVFAAVFRQLFVVKLRDIDIVDNDLSFIWRIPPKIFKTVDFPAPLGPRITTNSPLQWQRKDRCWQ